MRTHHRILIALLGVTITSCGAQLNVRRLPATPKSLGKVSGLVVNHNAPHEVIAVFPEKPGSTKTLAQKKTQAFFASATEVQEIDYSGAMFATRRLEVELHPDSSLKRAKISSTSSLGDDLSSLASAAKTYGETSRAIEEAEAEPEPVQAENDALLREIRNLMLKANLDALQRGEPLPYPEVGLGG